MTDIQTIQETEALNKTYEAENRQMSSERREETPKELSEHYRIVRKLGEGSQAHVYEAERLSDGQKVAIKSLRIDSIKAWKEYELFQRETQVLQSLQMDGVAAFYESIECLEADEPKAYIVQEYIEGRSIAQMMASGFRLDLNHIFQLTIDMIELLEKLHHHEPQIIHRDIKPSNIMLKPVENGHFKPYLIDFGAVANPQIQSGGSTVAGTYGYMPPEQLMGRPAPASDIYALAASLVFLISGTEPGDMQVTDFRLIIEPHLENVPRIITEILRQMLDPNPQTRLCDYKKIKDLFFAFLNNDFSSATTATSLCVTDEQILQVRELCQAGNLNIWAALPDNVPRDIPKPYQNIRDAGLFSNQAPGYRNKVNAVFIIYTLISLVFLFFVEKLSIDNLIIVLVMPTILFVLFNIYIKKKSPIESHLVAIKKDGFSEKQKNAVKRLLTHGKKTVATIVEIKFMPLDSELQVSYTLINQAKMREMASYYHGIPCVKVRYRFNPLEDDNPNDLVHEIIIHYDPQNTLAKGTPLPILYEIDPMDKTHVSSMPYPFPLCDVASLKNIYYDNKTTDTESSPSLGNI